MEAEKTVQLGPLQTSLNDDDADLPRFRGNSTSSSFWANWRVTFSRFTWIKLGLLLIGFIGLAFNSTFAFAMPHDDVQCMVDKVFEKTAGLNSFFEEHDCLRHALLIFSSLCIDIVCITAGLNWVFYSKTWRLMISLGLFYGVRSLVQMSFHMRFPDGYIFDAPGFPSLVVSYLRTSDFFFSGHVGLPIVVALEWKRENKLACYILCIITCLVEAFMMIALRGHYSIDIFTGVIVAHYCFMISESYVHYIDNTCMGMGKKNNQKEREKETEEGKNNYLQVTLK